MKVFAVPDAVPAPAPDYTNYDFAKMQADEDTHCEALKEHLRESGYTGKYTGGIARFGVADGCAQYMLADGNGIYGRSFLIHLPYGDAWHYRGIEHFPKKEIVQQIERDRSLASIFSKKNID